MYHLIENNTRISEAISKIQEQQDALKGIIKQVVDDNFDKAYERYL